MQITNSPQNAIETRESTRNFHESPISIDDTKRIEAYLNNQKHMIGPFGTSIKLELLLETNTRKKEKIGTYGFIKNAQGYIIGSSIKNTKALFDFAYVFEDVILYLTTLGIGTCWLGGTFERQHLMSSLSLAENMIIPAIAPIGYPKETRHFKERVQRTVIKANKRKSEDQLFFYENFGQPLGDRAKDYQLSLHYVRIAPSAKNKQPWRLIFNTALSQVHFYIASALADDDKYACEPEYLDIGVAYNHFKAGIDEMGIAGKLIIEEPEIQKPQRYYYITTWQRD